MTAIDTTTPGPLTTVGDHHLVLNLAVSHAVRRDLGRLDRVLGEPLTTVRRQAIARHVRFVLDLLVTHFAAQDYAIWPAAVLLRPDLAGLAERVGLAHDDLAGTFDTARAAAISWTDSAESRLATRLALAAFTTSVEPVLEQDAELLPLARAVSGLPIAAAIGDAAGPVTGDAIASAIGDGPVTGDAIASAIGDAAGRAPRRPLNLRVVPNGVVRPTRVVLPTKVAKRLFWLLDDLDPQLAERLLHGTPRAALWVLRNGFSGAYNRGSYLMWVGGGTGPAV